MRSNPGWADPFDQLRVFVDQPSLTKDVGRCVFQLEAIQQNYQQTKLTLDMTVHGMGDRLGPPSAAGMSSDIDAA